MKECKGDIFDPVHALDVICIPTSGYVAPWGEAVLTQGVAKEALKRWPSLNLIAGKMIKEVGNIPLLLTKEYHGIHGLGKEQLPYALLAFPCKPITCMAKREAILPQFLHEVQLGRAAPGYMAKSSPLILENSAKTAVGLADIHVWQRIGLPRVGAEVGDRDWQLEILPVLLEHLDDRFIIFQP